MQKAFKVYDFTLAAGGAQELRVEGDYFRIQSSTGPVDVTIEGLGTLPALQAGQGQQHTPYRRLLLRDASGAPNAGFILVSGQDFIDNRTYGVNSLDAATLAALSSVDLKAATLLTLTRPPVAAASLSDLNVLAANTGLTVFNAVSNVNGAIVHSAQMGTVHFTAFVASALIAKATAPTGLNQGDCLLMTAHCAAANGAANVYMASANMTQPVRIAPGLGLWFISDSAGATAFSKAVRYTLL